MTDDDLQEHIITWQPDLYQRYELLRQAVERASEDIATRPVRIIDVGSGPERLTERALGPGYEVVRTDVGDFDDDEIVRIRPGAPLPFEDGAADIVIAMDVLEHVADALRPTFLGECSRVARSLVVVTCPTQSADVSRAEQELSELMVALSNAPVEFLDEHAAYGLPSSSSVVADLEQAGWGVAVLENAPLSIWSSTNLIDFVLNLRLGQDARVRTTINAMINDGSVVCPEHEPGYRQFFIASPEGAIDVESIRSALVDDRAVSSISSIVARSTDEFAAAIETIDVLRLQITALDAATRNAQRSNDVVIRARLSAEEQLRTARRELAAASAEYLELERFVGEEIAAPVDVAGEATPPTVTVRSVAGKMRRSPRWAARKARGAVRQAGQRTAPLTAPSADAADEAPAPPARFDRHWYLIFNPDVASAGMDPWLHYVRHGRFEGRSAHPLFDRGWYSTEYPDAAALHDDPFLDWATHPVGREPNQFFDSEWYLARHPEVAEAGLDPVEHYRLHGWREGRWPGPLFDPNWYLGTYPDVADADVDPLTHYLQYGRGEGRHANHLEHVASVGWYRPPDGLIPWFSPVNFGVWDDLSGQPRLNVLLPGMGVRHLTGGPNTAIQLAYRLAARGQAVRFIATDAALDEDTTVLWEHMATISDVGRRLPNVEVVDGSNRHRRVMIGENDLFMATAWWTAQSIKAALPLVRQQRFLYLIQDFEPLFFASSSQYALALETYGLDHVPIVNSRFLLDHLAEEGVGRFSDRSFVESAIVFEPTVDRTLFRPTVPSHHKSKRRLLFYARPVNGLRNLFELGAAAVQLAVQQGVLDESEWEFCGMGEQFSPVAVGPRSILRPLPWKDFTGYAEQMRESDILLSLMLAPHPSYPPLEMAACGGVAVTTEFGPKTRKGLADISPNIIGTPATIEGIAEGIADAVDRLDDMSGRLVGSSLALPETWGDAFEQALPLVEEALADLADPASGSNDPTPLRPTDRYSRWRTQRIQDRRTQYPEPELLDPVTFSLLTAVWNTPGEFLRELADSVRTQELTHGWEWVIADNGSTNPDTLAVLDELRGDDRIRIETHPTNRGILGGMRSCLDRAVGRYILHVDHDDLLTADALRVVASSLAANGWPRAFYSDEDKVERRRFLEPYLKPDWDPLLFVNSCYIAHLCGVDRELAIEVGAYLDPYTEASPDWDLFMRVSSAGVVPHHVHEVVYSWRIHPSSTAANPSAKPYAFATHRRVLERFVETRADFARFTVEVHPDSPDELDWWIRRRRVDARPLVSVLVGDGTGAVTPLALVDHSIHRIAASDIERLSEIVDDAVTAGALVHLVNSSAQPLRSDWYWEALGLFELHPDLIAVGGPIVRDQRIVSAGDVFGFGPTGWASPEEGEPYDSRGWFAQTLKQRSVDGVAGDHSVFCPHALRRTLAAHRDIVSVATIGALSCIEAAKAGQRVGYSPLLRAHVAHSFVEQWSPTEAALIATMAAQNASSRSRSEFLSLDPARPFDPTSTAVRERHLARLAHVRPPSPVSYHDWLTAEVATRAGQYPASHPGPSVSIITPVYGGTDAALFAELSCSLREQSHPFDEWIIGLDGEIQGDLEKIIDALVADTSTNIRTAGGTKGGILATMRSCLADCTGDYVVPIDADDLLTPDALHILMSVAVSEDLPDLIHSDEDVLDGDRFRDPLLRPDWDPVLHLAGSYVWHALCIKRSTASELELYDDPRFEWCHDWDTVDRIHRADGKIVHVPEVLYHWRRHAGSSTNTDNPESDQGHSVRSLLERTAVQSGEASRYEVAEFPLWRGATEYHLHRRHVDAPSMSVLQLGPPTDRSRLSTISAGSLPWERVRIGPDSHGRIGDLSKELAALDTELVWLLDSTLIAGGEDPIWDALKWFELLPDVGAVCGRRVDADGITVSGAGVLDPRDPSSVIHPMAGAAVQDPGPYAMAFKPHTIDLLDFGCAVVHRTRLLASLDQIAHSTRIDRAGLLAAAALRDAGWRTVYSPLMCSLTDRVENEPIRTSISNATSRPGARGLSPIISARSRFR